MKVGSLFSGIGGFDLGLERAGMEVRWQCEIDTAAQSVLRRHWPDAVLYDDVTTLGGDVERVDLIAGGFPCQDLSVAGRRAGLAGKRSGLFYEFMRVVDEIAPAWVLIENVPGLLSSNGGRDMGAVLGTLGELGYGWAYRVLDAQYFGVAQRRRRVFIVGCLGDSARAAQVLFEPESLPGDTPPRREAGARLAQELAACLNSGGNNGGFRTEPGEHLVAQFDGHSANGIQQSVCVANTLDGDGRDGIALCLMAKANDSQDPSMQTYVTHALTAEGHDASEDGTGRGTPLTVDTLVSNGDAHSGFRNDEGCVAFEPGSVARNAGPAGESPQCPTLRSDMGDNQPAIRQGMAVRRLTPTECERLQGFPDGWTAEGADGPQSDSARYRQLGNAVCVNVAEWIGRRIMEAQL